MKKRKYLPVFFLSNFHLRFFLTLYRSVYMYTTTTTISNTGFFPSLSWLTVEKNLSMTFTLHRNIDIYFYINVLLIQQTLVTAKIKFQQTQTRI